MAKSKQSKSAAAQKKTATVAVGRKKATKRAAPSKSQTVGRKKPSAARQKLPTTQADQVPPVGKRAKLLRWLRRHRADIAVLLVLLFVAGWVSATNMTGSPERFEDEGTYISQAWAIEAHGKLTHYTYWYDHPPLGWVQMAGHLVLTDALGRYSSAITAGREFMLLLHLITIGLLYALARRLNISTLGAAIGIFAYALSPLTVEFSRYVLLDNVALPWLIGAFLLALSPRRSLLAAVGSALCMSVAVLSKETFLVLLPVLLYALWLRSDKRNRRYTFVVFGVVFIMVNGFYFLYAVLKNELFPGTGHVSLIGTLLWQLFERKGSGSILDAHSDTRGLISFWLNIDFWLLALGCLALPFSLWERRLRPIGFSLLVSLVLLLRSGYLPYPYVVIMLPFAALTLAGVADWLLLRPMLYQSRVKWISAGTVTGLLLCFIVFVIVPAWQPKLYALTHTDEDRSSRQAVAWITHHVSREKRVVVESALWTDLQDEGFNRPDPVWLYKTETDPEVVKNVGGWRGIDYVILNGPTIGAKSFNTSFPTVSIAIRHSKVVTQFGKDNQKILVFQVQH